MSCNSTNPNVNKTFIIEPLQLTSDTSVFSACTTLFTNKVESCSGGTTAIAMRTGVVGFNSNVDGILSLTANTVNANTFLSGGTNILDIVNTNDTFLTGQTFNNSTYILTSERNDGVAFNTDLSVLASDIFVLSGVYNPSTGIVTYTNSTGGTFQVSGFTTGMTDSFTTNAYLSGNQLRFDNNIQGSNFYNVDLSPIAFSGGSGSCISNLYISNLYGCSPITIHDSLQHTGSNASGALSTAFGFNTTASGNHSHAGGFTSFENKLVANGTTSFVHSTVTGSTKTYGAYGNYSSILGGLQNIIESGSTNSSILGGKENVINPNVERSTILGGQNITATTTDTVYVPNININSTPTNNNSLTQILGRNSTTGQLEYRDASTLGSGDTFVTGGTFSATTLTLDRNDGNSITVTGFTSTSGISLTDLSVGSEGSPASGNGSLSYNNSSGVFTYTPPILNGLTATGTTNFGSNKITYSNNYATLGDLPSATTYHGMFAHVHAEGAAYYAHAGNWVKLADHSQLTFVTGGTFSSTTLTLNRNDGNSVTVTGFTSGDTFVTGGTFSTNALTLNRNDGNSITVTGFTSGGGGTGDTFVTGFTYNDANKFTLKRNQGQSDLTSTINAVTGLTINGGLTGKLFAVNDISGLPIFEVYSDDRILMGSSLALSLNATAKKTVTAGLTTMYSITKTDYTGAFFDYTIVGNGGARSGNIMSIWSGSTAEFNEVTTNDIGSSTSGVTFSVSAGTTNVSLMVSAVTGSYDIKTIIRGI